MFDEDNSESLTYAEFEEGLKKFKVDMNPEDIQILMQELDEDRSGRVELDEFVTMMTKHSPPKDSDYDDDGDDDGGIDEDIGQAMSDDGNGFQFDGYTMLFRNSAFG